MSVESTAICAFHPGQPATFACPRCGTFGCRACERRTRPEASPVCPTCDARRNEIHGETTIKEHMAHANNALGLGIAALIPCLWPFQLGALIYGIRALLRLRKTNTNLGQGRIVIGLCLACLGILGSFAAFVALIATGKM